MTVKYVQWRLKCKKRKAHTVQQRLYFRIGANNVPADFGYNKPTVGRPAFYLCLHAHEVEQYMKKNRVDKP